MRRRACKPHDAITSTHPFPAISSHFIFDDADAERSCVKRAAHLSCEHNHIYSNNSRRKFDKLIICSVDQSKSARCVCVFFVCVHEFMLFGSVYISFALAIHKTRRAQTVQTESQPFLTFYTLGRGTPAGVLCRIVPCYAYTYENIGVSSTL